MPGADSTNVPGVRIEEVDGVPSGFARKIVVPNGSLALSAAIATLSLSKTFGIGGQTDIGGIPGGTVGADRFIAPNAHKGTVGTSDDGSTRWVAPFAGTLRNLRARNAAALGATEELVLTARINAVDSALTVTIPGGSAIDTLVSDTVNSVAFLAGDKFSFKLTSTDGGANGLGWGVQVDV